MFVGEAPGAEEDRTGRPFVGPAGHKLEEMRAEIMKTYPEGTIPLPPFWGGFRLTPERFEFWSDGVHRYHDRFCYVREGASWTLSRMAP